MDPEKIREKRLALFKDDRDSDKQLPLMADEIRARGGVIKRQIYETGQVLTEAKDLMEHGKFKSWIRDQEFDFSYQTANNFMNVYRTCLGRPDIAQTIPLSILYQIAGKGFPKDLREFILVNAGGLKKIKSKEIRDIQKRF
jgi:Tfp pilus assembly pilus retraction ATPase PilT